MISNEELYNVIANCLKKESVKTSYQLTGLTLAASELAVLFALNLSQFVTIYICYKIIVKLFLNSMGIPLT